MIPESMLPVAVSVAGVLIAGGVSWGIVKANSISLSKRMDKVEEGKVDTTFCDSSMNNIQRELSLMRKEFNDKLDMTITLLKSNSGSK